MHIVNITLKIPILENIKYNLLIISGYFLLLWYNNIGFKLLYTYILILKNKKKLKFIKN